METKIEMHTMYLYNYKGLGLLGLQQKVDSINLYLALSLNDIDIRQTYNNLT